MIESIRMSHFRRAKAEAQARMEQVRLDGMRIERVLRENRFEEDDETRAAERERARGLQLVHLRCTAITRSGTICKRSGTHMVNGRNLCMTHKVMHECSGSMPARGQKRRRGDADLPSHAVECKRCIILDEDDLQCTICYAKMEECDMTLTNCGHVFHESCLRTWRERQTTCPKCRKHTNAFRTTGDRLILARRIAPRSFC
jgi:hypothetical protein